MAYDGKLGQRGAEQCGAGQRGAGQRQFGHHSAMDRRETLVRDAVAQTVSLARLARHSRDRLGDELVRLGALQELARVTPMAWRKAALERREELGFWLFNVAIGVAATGDHAAGLALLQALPCVGAGERGRRELLLELCGDQLRLAA